jgi:hypothetical protein
MAKSCKKGYYYCNTSKKCKKIPKGYHVMSSGYLMRDNEHQDEKETEGKKKNGNGNGNYSNGNGNGNGSSSDGGSEGGGGGVSEAWSAKYKKSIDCDNPKGFSQKSHCRGREKVSEGKNGDHEVAMAQSQLKKSAENIAKLRKGLGKKEKDIPAWMQAKITDTAHDTDAAAGYVDKMNESKSGDSSLRDWFSKSKSSDGKPGWVQLGGKYAGKPCAKQPGQKTKPKCGSSKMSANLNDKEEKKAFNRKQRQDPNPNRKGKAINVKTESHSNWKQDLNQLDEIAPIVAIPLVAAGGYAAYKGLQHLKKKADSALDNARQNATINGKPFGAGARQRAIEKAAGAEPGTLDPKMQRLRNSYEPEGELVDEGKKDACYHKVKSRYSVWPSAYASGALVKCRKVGAKNWGNKTKNESYEFSNWRDDFHATEVESIDLISNEPLQQSQGLGSDMLDEANSKQDKLKEISKQLSGASKMHAKQSKKVAKVAANLDEKCWKGYKKKGMKTMFGKRYPNCVKAHFSDWKSDMDLQEKKKKNCGCGKDPCKTYGKQEVKEDWQKSNRKDNVDGMSQKSVNAYKRENPGSKLKTAVTGKNPTGKDKSRRKSFCARSNGQRKMHNIDCSKTPDKKICKARKRWRC